MNGEGVRRVWVFVSAARGEKEKVSPSTATRGNGENDTGSAESLLKERMVTKTGFVGVLDSHLRMEYIRSTNGSSNVHRRVIRRALYWSLPLPLLVQGYSSFWHTRKFPPSNECKWKGNGCHSLIEVLRGRMRSLTPLFPLSWSWEHGWDEASSWGLAWLTWRS